MTKIKFCGLTCREDILAVNKWKPEYAGFVFAAGSRRRISFEAAAELKRILDPAIQAVGVFVNERPEVIADLMKRGVIDLAQLHGEETGEMVRSIQESTGRPVIRAFRIREAADVEKVKSSCADYVLLDSGAGSGEVFDWNLIRSLKRPYFLAGGLDPDNVCDVLERLSPFAVDVSTGIETNGRKDTAKMEQFTGRVRNYAADAALEERKEP